MSVPCLTLTDAAAALRRGEVTSVELLRQAMARADMLDAQFGVYLTRFDHQAHAAARQADDDFAARIDRGALQGIPVGLKDVLAAAEGPTTAQSLVLDPAWGAGRDAVVVERLRAGGAVITGKVSLMEFACGFSDPDKPFPQPRNPWNPAKWTGGSSSGAAAGVAAGFFLAGIGTDTAGSIRIPASYCGVCGLLPTFGRVPNTGCLPLGFSQDHIGPLARSARDCGAILGVIAGVDPRDPSTVDWPVSDYLAGLDGSLAGVRVGVERVHHFGEADDPALEPAFDAAIEAIAACGATVTEVELPHYTEAVTASFVTLFSEALAYHHEDLRTQSENYSAYTRMLLEMGAFFSGADYVQAQRVRRLAQQEVAALFRDVDVVATPTAATGAPDYERLVQRVTAERLTALVTTNSGAYWNAVGNPALAVPMGMNSQGLPLSLQLAGRPFEEALLIRVGDAYQRTCDWHLQVPTAAARDRVGSAL